MGEHGRGHRPVRAEQRITQGGEDRAVAVQAQPVVLDGDPPPVGVHADTHARVAHGEGVVARAGGHLHEHLPFLLRVAHAGEEVLRLVRAIRQREREGELHQAVLGEFLARLGPLFFAGVFRSHEKSVGIAEPAAPQDLLHRDTPVLGSLNERGRAAAVPLLAGRAQGHAAGSEVFCQ